MGGTWGRPYGDFRPFHSVRRYRIGFISCGGHRIAHDRNCLVGAGLLTRPSRFMETASSGTDTVPHPLPRLVGTRRGGEMEQAEILHRIRAQWPGRNHTRNRILRAGNFAEGCRGIPRRWGSGGGATMGGDAHRSPPLAAFWSLCRRGQRDSPRRAKPCEAARRVIAPYGHHGPRKAGGSGDPSLRGVR